MPNGNDPRVPLSLNVARTMRPASSLANLTGLLDRFPFRPVETRVPVRRPDDFLIFDLLFDNLRIDTQEPGNPRLVRSDSAKSGHLIVEFPPQSFGEEAYLDKTGPEVTSNAPPFPEAAGNIVQKNTPVPAAPALRPMPAARIRMSGKSRLAFTMPAGTDALPFNLASVLTAMRTWPQRRDASAAPEPALRIDLTSRAWWQRVAQSPAWVETKVTLGSGLRAVSANLERAVAESADRLAVAFTPVLQQQGRVSTDPDIATAELDRAMKGEIDKLLRAAPTLASNPEQRDAATASLVLQTVDRISAANLPEDLSLAPLFPLLPFLLYPHKPPAGVTAVELPYRLVISPIESARWTHRVEGLTAPSSGRTELWHTRLTTADTDTGADRPSKFRAIWSDDYPIQDTSSLVNEPPKPFRMSLDALDRQMLVKLMAGYNEMQAETRRAYIPRPTRARRLALSALGGLLDSEGNWNPRPAGVGLQQWRHLANMGRDFYVRVMYAGFLCPFGHAASLVKVTERKFESIPGSHDKQRVAVLRQRFYVVVREPVKEYPNAGVQPGWFDLPFTRVEILTRETPSLWPPGDTVCSVGETAGAIYGPAVPRRAAFWPMLAPDPVNANFRFDIVATDLAGKRITFSMPLLFVGDEANQSVAAAVVGGYNNTAISRRTGPVNGASVCFAPADATKQGDTKIPTTSVSFQAGQAAGGAGLPRFNPHTEQAEVGIPQIQRLLGQNTTVAVGWPDIYKATGFGASNAGQLFLKLLTPRELNFGSGGGEAKTDALGGLASPAMSIQGLSRVMGPVAAKPPAGGQTVDQALQKIVGNQFDPTDFFKGAKILGGIDLATVLDVASSLAGGNVPKMLSRDLPDRVEASFEWQTEIRKSDPLNLLKPGADGKQTILKMTGRMTAPIANPAAASFEADASMVHFRVNLFGFIVVWFDQLRFKAARGKKPDVAVDLHPKDAITFGGPLEFVNKLRELIPSNGFSDPPSLSVTPSGIAAGYSLNLPSVQAGIFTLANASLGASFALPFDSRPVEVHFNFCERQRPFSLTVSLFGGGGFFAIGLGTEGVREIEAALEFGAAVAIDLGVASGGVEVKGGVYFHWLQTGANKTVELSGYVRLHGELSILGLISASLTFNLSLSYKKEGSRSTVWGEATLVIEIEILFFSMDVSVKCRREFGGSDADPTFLDFIPAQPVWLEYCEAFAAE